MNHVTVSSNSKVLRYSIASSLVLVASLVMSPMILPSAHANAPLSNPPTSPLPAVTRMESVQASTQAQRIVQQLVSETTESGVCRGKTLSVQCYGHQDCQEVEALTRIALEPFAKSAGLRLRPIYRIWESESVFYRMKNGGVMPPHMKSYPISATMFHHTSTERACATNLAIAVGLVAHDIGTHERRQSIVPVEPVTTNMGSPGFIEFWWSMLP